MGQVAGKAKKFGSRNKQTPRTGFRSSPEKGPPLQLREQRKDGPVTGPSSISLGKI